jgi:hypothetical protein
MLYEPGPFPSQIVEPQGSKPVMPSATFGYEPGSFPSQIVDPQGSKPVMPSATIGYERGPYTPWFSMLIYHLGDEHLARWWPQIRGVV